MVGEWWGKKEFYELIDRADNESTFAVLLRLCECGRTMSYNEKWCWGG